MAAHFQFTLFALLARQHLNKARSLFGPISGPGRLKARLLKVARERRQY